MSEKLVKVRIIEKDLWAGTLRVYKVKTAEGQIRYIAPEGEENLGAVGEVIKVKQDYLLERSEVLAADSSWFETPDCGELGYRRAAVFGWGVRLVKI